MTALAQEEEKHLIERAQAGDRTAMGELMRHYGPPLLHGYLRPRTTSEDEAEEILCDTVARVVERFGTYKYQAELGFYPWLRRVAQRILLDRCRRRRRGELGAERYRIHQTAIEDDHVRSTEQETILAEERQRAKRLVASALLAIHPRYRRALEIRLIEDRSREESAAILAVSVATFDVVFHRALKALRNHIDRQVGDEPL